MNNLTSKKSFDVSAFKIEVDPTWGGQLMFLGNVSTNQGVQPLLCRRNGGEMHAFIPTPYILETCEDNLAYQHARDAKDQEPEFTVSGSGFLLRQGTPIAAPKEGAGSFSIFMQHVQITENNVQDTGLARTRSNAALFPEAQDEAANKITAVLIPKGIE